MFAKGKIFVLSIVLWNIVLCGSEVLQEDENVIQFEDRKFFVERDTPITLRARHIFEISERLYKEESIYQKIELFDTLAYGKIIVLNGIVQTSEKDEFIYHENICHLPMFYHGNPKKVLIIGGGDGGSLREVVKHPVSKVVMVEIDERVVELSKKYLPTVSDGAFEHKNVELVIDNAREYIKRCQGVFDVIILDISDPEGPAEDLVEEEFYLDVKNALRKGGVISVQSGSFTDQLDLVLLINQRLKKLFSSVKVHQAFIPTYQSSLFSFTIASDIDLNNVTLGSLKMRYAKYSFSKGLKYYTPEVHMSSAVFPRYLDRLLSSN